MLQVDGFKVAEDSENQCQPKGGFRGCDRDREKCKEGPVHEVWVWTIVPKRNQVEVPRIEHDFQTDQHDYDMPTRQRAHQTYREEDG